MCSFKTLGVDWPPRGWKQFSDVQHSAAQAIMKDPVSARVAGISYRIEPHPLYQEGGTPRFSYALQIDGWEYTIHNEGREFPILSFLLRDKCDFVTSKQSYISEIKVKSCPVRNTERSAHRAVMAALFFMKQVNSQSVPDVDRVLRLYKIHPNQRSLYSVRQKDFDSFGYEWTRRFLNDSVNKNEIENS